MAHQVYENFVLANQIEDQYNTYLDLARFCTVDNSLVGTPGMIKKINVYRATNGTEKLAMGAGNSKDIEVSYTEEEYEILMAQNRFKYFDEQEMTDPMVVETGLRHMATDMFNHINDDIYAEFNKATQVVTASAFNFDAFVDAGAMLNVENLEGIEKFGLVNPKDVAKVRKALKEDLKYVAEFSRHGYISTVGDWNLYTCKLIPEGTIVGGTKDAVTLFNKRGVEVEQDRDGDIRQNTIWSRKYYLAALTDATKAVKITLGT
jgi:hypothetical protein